MRFIDRYRKPMSTVALASLLVATLSPPASSYYHPKLGRFISADPNGTGVVYVPSLTYHGTPFAVTPGFHPHSQFADGQSLCQFVRGNPITGRDSSGLFSLPDMLGNMAIRAQLATSSFAAAYPAALRFVGGLLAAANLYAFAQYDEARAIILAQPNPMGFLTADAVALRVAMHQTLSTGGSMTGLARATTETRALAATAGAAIDGEAASAIGETHHAISTRIAQALSRHRSLRGLYTPRDPRFVTRAANESVHRGYQQWHRNYDAEVVGWLERNPLASQAEFENYLRGIYNRPEMRERFPHGLDE